MTAPVTDPNIERLRGAVEGYVTALMVDGGGYVAACEKELDAALAALSADLDAAREDAASWKAQAIHNLEAWAADLDAAAVENASLRAALEGHEPSGSALGEGAG